MELASYLALDKISDASQRKRAEKLVKQVCAKDVPEIDEAVKRKRADVEGSQPPWMTAAMRQEVWEETLRGAYYDILANVLGKIQEMTHRKRAMNARKKSDVRKSWVHKTPWRFYLGNVHASRALLLTLNILKLLSTMSVKIVEAMNLRLRVTLFMVRKRSNTSR